ncbi:CHASE2 domain-containing protein [Novosphingobium flavum]|uniref:CHASE2 domain-containing protein n=1 Tax=Novosphingobium aerophilum TaxID=2839843 RepID=UPI001639F22F|nr:CHASE2 domain-containing protein [Novosphingobium aerophilum]
MSAPRSPLRREWWLLAAICLIGAAALERSGLTARLDHIVYDALLSRRPAPATGRILVVALDERSLTSVGPWPWPRTTQAQLVRRLAAARPRAIGLDVLLSEPRDAAGDRALAEAIAAAGNVYLPLAFTVPGRNGRPVDLERAIPAIARASAGTGHVNLSPDADGVTRSAWLTYGAGGARWSALPAAMLGQRPGPVPIEPGVTRSSPVMIDFPGPAGTLATVSAASVLRGEVPPELIAGKYVLVGMTASGLGDMHATPMAGAGPLMPGVEIQGSLLATLLSDRHLVPGTPVERLGFSLAPVLLLVLALAALPTRRGLLAALALTLATLAASAALLMLANLWLPPATAMVALVASYAVWSWRRLAVASHLVSRELERASREAGLLAQGPPEATGGVLDRQLALLADITARERELRHEHDAVIRLLSHDMRAPQSAILALLDSNGDCPPELAARLRSHAHRTLDLADGFVSLSRAQLVELGAELISLTDIALDAADTLWAQARARTMMIRVIEPQDEMLVRGDRSLLTRMLVNLVDNAVKYGEAGTDVILRIATAPDQARIDITNHGPDIPPDQLEQIFERFARAPDANRRADGFGLGLAFVQTVATRHGGRVDCRSQDGETGFSVELPLARP